MLICFYLFWNISILFSQDNIRLNHLKHSSPSFMIQKNSTLEVNFYSTNPGNEPAKES